MISKSERKLIKSLQIKKYRQLHQLFLVEGEKNLVELLQSQWQCQKLFCSEDFHSKYTYLLQNIDYHITSAEVLASVGSFQSNSAGIALVTTLSNRKYAIKADEYVIALDNLQDPGNLGTILRIADWYGIDTIICSESSVDVYNPKVISASMGAFTRVKVFYENLSQLFENTNVTIYGADLQGEDLHKFQFNIQKGGILLLGNESQGIQSALRKTVHHFLHIPKFGGAESLNVAIATAVICDNLKRQLKESPTFVPQPKGQ